jgi:hypothetical protein
MIYSKTHQRIRRAAALTAVCSLISLTGCGGGSSSSNNAPVTIQADDGYYRITMDYTTGVSSREMGRQLATQLRQTVAGYEANMTDMLKRQLMLLSFVEPPLEQVDFPTALARAKTILVNVPTEYVEEIRGMQEVFNSAVDDPNDGILSANELLVIQLFPDVLRPSGCSASAALGDASLTGKTVFGRNLDWFSYPLVPASKIQAMTTIKKANSTLVNFTAAGLLPAGSTFNQHKVFGAVLDAEIPTVPYPNPAGMRSYVFDLRYALENNSTLQQVADYMTDAAHIYTFNHLVFLADANVAKTLENNVRQPNATPPVRALRSSTSPITGRPGWNFANAIATVNDFRLPGTYFNPTDVSNSARWTSFNDLFTRFLSANKVGIDQLKSIAGFPGTNSSGDDEQGALFLHSDGSAPSAKYTTMQSIIMNMDTLETWVHFAPAGGPFPTNPTYRRIRHTLEAQ